MNLAKLLTKQEIDQLMERSDWKAIWELCFTWGVIVGVISVAIIWTNPITLVLAWIVVGARQLALAILMHDFSHYAMFKRKRVNQLVGQWLCAYPMFLDLEKYREYHLSHHSHTGSNKDPDLYLVNMYPSSEKSLIRKFLRDLVGFTGIKSYIGLAMMNMGLLEYELGGRVIKKNKDSSKLEQGKSLIKGWWGPVTINLIGFAVFCLVQKPWLFLALWICPLLTTSMFFLRIRSIAEHGVTPDRNNPLQNTRTTLATWYQKFLFAPHNVHYHLEHHLLMTVPSYNLPAMHSLLLKKGLLKDALVECSYWTVLKKAILKS
jgi:fatty acid desaturase